MFLRTHNDPAIRLVFCAGAEAKQDPIAKVFEDYASRYDARLSVRYCRVPEVNGSSLAAQGDQTGINFPCAVLVNNLAQHWFAVTKGPFADVLGKDFYLQCQVVYTAAAVEAEVYPLTLTDQKVLGDSQHSVEVWNIIGPNLNASKQHCIAPNKPRSARYQVALPRLDQCYVNLFAKFSSHYRLDTQPVSHTLGTIFLEPDWWRTLLQARDSVFTALNLTPPTQAQVPLALELKAKGYPNFLTAVVPTYDLGLCARTPVPKVPGVTWQKILAEYVAEPVKLELANRIFWRDAKYAILYDAYPKSSVHLLVIPTSAPILTPRELDSSHLSMLQDMYKRAKWAVQGLLDQNPSLAFRIGFHAIPSLGHLHMHIISQDFTSASLKKPHWFSFTTMFFLDAELLITTLSEKGSLQIDADALQFYAAVKKAKDQPFECFRCGRTVGTLPTFKQHLHKCQGGYPKHFIQK
jgi:aprataxin